MSDKVTINLTGLDALAKAFKGKLPVVKIGILGNSDSRTAQVQGLDGNFTTESSSNTTIGAAHEYGTTSIPQRSFLRVPLMDHLDKAIEKSGLKKQDYLKEVIKTKSILVWMKQVAIIAEAVVKEGFLTRGYGKWAPWKNPGYSNNTGQVLMDTTQLSKSITTEVK